MSAEEPRLLAKVKGRIRARRRSLRTEQAYVGWTSRHIQYHGMRQPTELGEVEIGACLTPLATERRVLRSTQLQALSASLLIYRAALGVRGLGVRSPADGRGGR